MKKIHWIPHVPTEIISSTILIQEVKKQPLERYFIPIPSSVQRAVTQRQYEYISGRLCAYTACKQLTGLNHAVQRDSKGRPIWPSGLVGSIAHTGEIAVAAVAKESHIKNIGIDSESITLNEQILSSIENLVLVGDENHQIKKKEELILIFSFKEALYKCISSRIDRVLDFKEIEIIEINRMHNKAHLKFEGDIYAGYYTKDLVWNHFHSCVCIHR